LLTGISNSVSNYYDPKINASNPLSKDNNSISNDIKKTENNKQLEKELKKMGLIECETCKNRKYVDSSGDSGVSFKGPTSISPGASFTAVASHEGEHIAIAQNRAQQTNSKVISQTIQVFTAVCPECGKPHASGGQAVTKTLSSPKTPSPQITGKCSKIDLKV